MSSGWRGWRSSLSPTRTSVPRDARLEPCAVGGVEPDDAAAPAKPCDGELFGVGLSGGNGPGDGGIEIGEHLRIGHALDNRTDLLHACRLLHVTLTRKKLRRDGEVALLRKPSADIRDVLVNAENLVHDEHERAKNGALCLGLGHGAIRGDATVARGDRDLARLEARAARRDGACAHGLDGEREARAQRAGEQRAARSDWSTEKLGIGARHGVHFALALLSESWRNRSRFGRENMSHESNWRGQRAAVFEHEMDARRGRRRPKSSPLANLRISRRKRESLTVVLGRPRRRPKRFGLRDAQRSPEDPFFRERPTRG